MLSKYVPGYSKLPYKSPTKKVISKGQTLLHKMLQSMFVECEELTFFRHLCSHSNTYQPQINWADIQEYLAIYGVGCVHSNIYDCF
jgi:hypothetical protein